MRMEMVCTMSNGTGLYYLARFVEMSRMGVGKLGPPLIAQSVEGVLTIDQIEKNPWADPSVNLAAFFEHHRQGGVTFCRNMVKDIHLAEDMYQDACIRIQKSRHRRTATPSILTALLFTTLKNLCLSFLRKRSHKDVSLEQFCMETEIGTSLDLEDIRSPAPDQGVLASERSSQIMEALALLEPRHRYALLLKVMGEYSYQEIAIEMNITETHAGVLIYRARLQLKKLLGVMFPARGSCG